MFLSKKLKECRETAGLKRNDLIFELYSSAGLKLSPGTWSNWESGRSVPDANALWAIASFFKKPLEYFFK